PTRSSPTGGPAWSCTACRRSWTRFASMPSSNHEDPWLFPEATQVALLCGWNAFALQLLGDRLLCADYEADPLTVGYVEGVIADQALACYGQVPGWLSRSQQALHSPAYELDVAVPAPLPAWIGRGWTGVYVAGLYPGLEAVRSHA